MEHDSPESRKTYEVKVVNRLQMQLHEFDEQDRLADTSAKQKKRRLSLASRVEEIQGHKEGLAEEMRKIPNHSGNDYDDTIDISIDNISNSDIIET